MRRSLGAETVEIGGTVESRLVLHNHKKLPALWVFWRDAIEPGLAADGVTCGFRPPGAPERSVAALKSMRGLVEKAAA